ncbi:Nse1 non-SMC component of SMC5-6 complex-domain-containing protein [Crepidotus variabilis]|uniref:Non-structural maintenance of chromosomes element 1 homolog n=1 Tax=Crepidotus variabilis TaxID=179855 RepID=A0A9P6JTT3_9AGAR|nr:Nse1 non-SMC component of SMC5-6 complex-domain-containing protein [Crepidotus variabilis]
MPTIRDVDRVFLQAVLSRGVLSGALAKVLWEKSVEVVNAADEGLDIEFVNNDDAWNVFTTRINNTLDKLDLEFRLVHDELSGRDMYALVNTKGDEVAQLATDYTPIEIAFFKAIVEQIMLASREAYSVSSLAALRELTFAKINMTKSHGEIVLASFVSKGWLMKSIRGRYSLSTRSLLELQPYLKSNYSEELRECTLCMEILTRGIACPTANCNTRLHFHCFKNYRQRQGRKNCPSCQNEWPREIKDLVPVGEEAARDGDEKRRVRVRSAGVSDDEEEAPEDSPPRKSSQRKGKGKPRRKAEADDEDEDEEEEEEESQMQTQPSHPSQTQKRRSSRR